MSPEFWKSLTTGSHNQEVLVRKGPELGILALVAAMTLTFRRQLLLVIK